MGPLYRWRFTGRTPERLLVVPPDLRLSDPTLAQEIYYGRFQFSGHVVDTGGVSPFQLNVSNRGWVKALHGFRWLRHLRAAGTELAAVNARALVNDWIRQHGSRMTDIAWEPGTVAKRIIAWLQYSAFLLTHADANFHRLFLKNLAVQVRYLRATVGEMPPGKERVRARIALAFVALALPSSAAGLRNAARHLDAELDLQILPDGGHISRNPLVLLELLADLLPLRQVYANQSATPPASLIASIDRMMPALRAFRHKDGAVARFNGMGVTIHERVSAILRLDDAAAAPLLHAPHSGYDRLELGQTVVIADTGSPPPTAVSTSAHAGCLSFELSSGRQCFIVNCGVDSYGSPDLRPLARATAAHSTATLNETSQARFVHSNTVQGIVGAPLTGTLTHTECRRIDQPGMQGFIANHNAYEVKFGIIHEREIQLSANGNLIYGEDRFSGKEGLTILADGKDHATIRFHIHPTIRAEQARSGEIYLLGQSGECWLFTSLDSHALLEESVFFASTSGARRTSQIVISALLSKTPVLRWRLLRETQETAPSGS
ncbi:MULTISPECIES: heparinase II/III family protein [Mesorhizobium]|uniref:Heparinase n=2 Tax=Mesorhizobium denitrificans TaxID=2294114 RepID=A0A371XC78_9HYPH|nr:MULTISPECIES: heparinase II/III family protein [Mesorhizobium]RFC66838.1 heparinase [Mesorhizobium denitrificans]